MEFQAIRVEAGERLVVAELDSGGSSLPKPACEELRTLVHLVSTGEFEARAIVLALEGTPNNAPLADVRHVAGLCDEIESLETPVIAALCGRIAGDGFDLALACDLRYASEDCATGWDELPGPVRARSLSRLVRLVGLSAAKDLALTGRLVSTSEARAMGLIHRIAPVESLAADARAFALTLASRAPQALGLGKKLLNAAAGTDLDSGVALESLAQAILIKTEDHREGVRAFREKRRPDFGGR